MRKGADRRMDAKFLEVALNLRRRGRTRRNVIGSALTALVGFLVRMKVGEMDRYKDSELGGKSDAEDASRLGLSNGRGRCRLGCIMGRYRGRCCASRLPIS